MSYRCNSSSPFVKVSKKCQKSVTKDFEIFPGGNGSVHLAVTIDITFQLNSNNLHLFQLKPWFSTSGNSLSVTLGSITDGNASSRLCAFMKVSKLMK